MQHRQNVAQKPNGDIVAGASVTVTTYPGGVAAVLYYDNGITPIPGGNVVSTDLYGNYSYYVANGRYTETISGSGLTTQTLQDIVLADPAVPTITSGTITGASIDVPSLKRSGKDVLATNATAKELVFNPFARQLVAAGVVTSVATGNVTTISGTTRAYYFLSGSSLASSVPATQTRGGYTSITNNPASTKTPGSLQYSVYHYGSKIEFQFNNQGGTTYYLIRIDGKYYSLSPNSLTSTTAFLLITFPSVARRRIDLICAQTVPLLAITVNANDGLDPAPTRGKRIIVLGDSMTIGNNGTIISPNGFAYQLGDYLGCDDVWSSGLGGTGYMTTVNGFANNMMNRAASDVIANSPDTVLVAGGGLINDTVDATTIANATTLYAALRSGLPNAQIFVSMLYNNPVASMTSANWDLHDSLKSAATSAGCTFIDLLDMPIQSVSSIQSTTLLSSVSAGDSLFYTADALFGPRDTFEIGTGAKRERVDVVSNGGDKRQNISGTFRYAHSAGEPVIQKGRSLWTGPQASAAYGTNNSYVSADGTHPTDAGHEAIAINLAALMSSSLYV